MGNDNLDKDYELYKQLESKRDEKTINDDYTMYKKLEEKRDTKQHLNDTLVINVDPKRYSHNNRINLLSDVENLKEVDNTVMFITKRGFKKHINSKAIVTAAITGLILITTIGLDRVSNVSEQYEATYNDPYAYNSELQKAIEQDKEEQRKMDLMYDPNEYVKEQQLKEQQEFYQRYIDNTIQVTEEEESNDENLGKGLGK